MRFVWDDANLEHIARHSVEDVEAEEVLEDPGVRPFDAQNRRGEKRYGALGATEDGRILVVIYTLREGYIRVVTARDAEPKEKKRYRRV